MKMQYAKVSFRSDTLKMIGLINDILSEYISGGFVLTVRQLYYQMVSRNYIPNNEKSYKKIVNTVNDGRIAGLIDWDIIEDLTRGFIDRSKWTGPRHIMNSVLHSYHQDMWDNQPNRVFCIIEKEALTSVFKRVCHSFDVPLLAARGYPSASALREFAYRRVENSEQRVIILHLGDHDPSGIDMTRDLEERIALFSHDSPFELHRLALNYDQIEELKPPPNPAKQTDTRFNEYEAKYGSSSWELDALSPQYLETLVRSEIMLYQDQDRWTEKLSEIEANRAKLSSLADKL